MVEILVHDLAVGCPPLIVQDAAQRVGRLDTDLHHRAEGVVEAGVGAGALAAQSVKLYRHPCDRTRDDILFR